MVVVGVVDAVDVVELELELLVLPLEVVGAAVVGEAVVGAGGGGGIVAPAGRQIDRPGYSGVDTVAPLTASTSASGAPEPSAMRIQKSPAATSYSSAHSSTASASTAAVFGVLSAVVVGSATTVASATGGVAPELGAVVASAVSGAAATGWSAGWSPLAGRGRSTVIDAVRTASPSSDVKPITTGTSSVRTTASPPRRANNGSTPDRGGSAGAVSQASSQSVAGSS